MKKWTPIILILFTLWGGCSQRKIQEKPVMAESIHNLDFSQALQQIQNETYRKFLLKFREQFSEQDRITITEHPEYFEAIVSHPDTRTEDGQIYTGGAEQYFINKKSGEVTMGWHEHPMIIEEIQKKPIDKDEL